MDEIRKVLQLSLGDSPKNVKELKSDIYELKNAIGDMVVAGKTGTTEYDQAVKLLGQDLQTLQQVQNSTKKEVDALDGSYNALVQRMRELKTEWRATNDEAKRNELGQQIVQINDQLKALDYGLGNFQRNVGNYGNAMQSLGQTVNVAQQAGSQFTNGLIAMGSVMNLTASEEKAMNAQLGVMQKGFAALNAAKGILGAVNALRSQAAATKAATVAQNENTVATNAGTVAQEGFNAAVKANPIGATIAVIMAVVAAIGALIAVFTKAHSKMKEYESQVNSVKEGNEKLDEQIEKNNKNWANQEKLYRALGIEGRKLVELQADQVKDNLKLAKSQLAVAEATEARFKQETNIENRSGFWKFFHKGKVKQLEEFTAQTDKARKTVEELEQTLVDLSYDAKAAGIKSAKDAAAAAAAEAEAEKKRLEKAAEEGEKALQEFYNKREKETLEWQEKLHKLVEGRDAEIAIAKAAGLPTEDIIKKYDTAVIDLYKKYLKNLQGVYAEEFKMYSDNEKKKLNLQETMLKEQSNAAKRMAIAMGLDSTGSLSFLVSKEDLKNSQKYLQEYKKSLQKFVNDFKDVAGEGLKETSLDKLLPEYMSDPSKFETKYGEPLTKAISSYFETIKSIEETGVKQISNTIDRYTSVIWEKIDAGNVKGAKSTINQFELYLGAAAKTFGKNSNAVSDFATQYANQIKGKFYFEMAQDPNISKKEALGFLNEWKKTALPGDKVEEIAAEAVHSFMSSWNSNLARAVVSGKANAESLKASLDEFKNAVSILGPEMADLFPEELLSRAEELINIISLKGDGENITKEWLELKTLMSAFFEDANNNIEALAENIKKVKKVYQESEEEINYKAFQKNWLVPLNSVANLLGNVAQAWENCIRAMVDAGDMSQEQAKKSFEAMKWLQYGVAIVSTAAAFTQALVDPSVPNFYVRLANAAAALAAGVAQAASIYATHYGSSGSNTTTTPTLVDRSPVTPTVSLNASEAGESMQQNMRVYVVESDITEAQDAARARVSESTF